MINYNIYANPKDYAIRYENTGTKLLLGTEYFPLREEFIQFHPGMKELCVLTETNPAFDLQINVKNMEELIQGCDIAVSAAGITMYELSAMGIPSITFSFADNQVLGAKRMQERGIMRYAGDLREHMPEKVKAIVQETLELSADFKKRKEISQR